MKKLMCVCLGVSLWVTNVCAEGVNNASAMLQSKLNAMHSMKAHFSQVVRSKKRTISRSSGTMALSRPGRFRWDTQNPMKQLVVADGQHLWIYDAALEQVTVRKQAKSVGGAAGLFLSGYNDTVGSDFNTTVKMEGNKAVFDLHAKSAKANFQRVKLVFNGPKLQGIMMYDQLGQCTDVTLSDEQSNVKLQTSLFKFKPPRGVDVVRQ